MYSWSQPFLQDMLKLLPCPATLSTPSFNPCDTKHSNAEAGSMQVLAFHGGEVNNVLHVTN